MKYTPEQKRKFVELIQADMPVEKAAAAVGIPRSTGYYWSTKYREQGARFHENYSIFNKPTGIMEGVIAELFRDINAALRWINPANITDIAEVEQTFTNLHVKYPMYTQQINDLREMIYDYLGNYFTLKQEIRELQQEQRALEATQPLQKLHRNAAQISAQAGTGSKPSKAKRKKKRR